MYHSRVTSSPRSVDAIISSSEALPPPKHQIHRRFAVFIRQRETVARRLFLRRLRGGAGVHQILRHAAIDQQNALARHPFPIERRAELQRMIGVIHDADVLAKDLLAHAVVEARPLVGQRRRREVVKQKTDDIEHRRGFENHRVPAGRQVPARWSRDAPFRSLARPASADRSRARSRSSPSPSSPPAAPAW